MQRLTRASIVFLLALLAMDLATAAQCCEAGPFPQHNASAALDGSGSTTDSVSHDVPDCFCCGRSLAPTIGLPSLPDLNVQPAGFAAGGCPASAIVPQYHPPQL